MTTWLTPVEAAEYLKCSDRTVRDAVKAGDIPAYRIGRLMRLKASDLDAWVEAKAWEPAS